MIDSYDPPEDQVSKKGTIYNQDYFSGKNSFFWKLGYGRFSAFYFRGLFKPVLKYIGVAKEGKVLDIGCAYGFLLDKFPDSWQKFGIDISEYAIGKARRRLPSANFLVADAQDSLPFEENFFDIVLFNDTLEHLEKPEVALKNVYTVLKRGGILYITTPNLNYIRRILLRDADKKEHHISIFSHLKLRTLLVSSGFSIEEEHTSFYSLFCILRFKSNMGMESVFICKK